MALPGKPESRTRLGFATSLIAAAAILVLHGPGVAGIDSPPETAIPLPEGNFTLETTVIFVFAGSDDVGVAGFECGLDLSPFAPCASPVMYERLRRGPHAFRVQAIDDRGIRGSGAIFVWGRR